MQLPRIAPEVVLRRTLPGTLRFEAPVDHCLSVHSGPPARVSCHGGTMRAVATRGEISIVPVGVSDECIQDDPSDTVDLTLPRALLRVAAEELGLDPDRAALEARFCVRDACIEHITWALEAEHRAGSPNGLLYRESLGLALAVHLLRSYRAAGRPARALDPAQLARVKRHVDEHLAGDVSLLRLARVAGVSASHFRLLFKRSTGLAVHEYVIRRRVERARDLLVEGKLPASQIAFEAGFSHQSHMARCMRRVLGLTPTAIARS